MTLRSDMVIRALAALGSGRCLVIGEVALSHDGSLGLAHAFVDAIADAGADAVKFQTHIAEAESTPAEPFRVAFSKQDATRYDYWVRMAFTEDEWRGLAEHCRRARRAVHLVAVLDRSRGAAGAGGAAAVEDRVGRGVEHAAAGPRARHAARRCCCRPA